MIRKTLFGFVGLTLMLLVLMRGAAWIREDAVQSPSYLQFVQTSYGRVAIDVRGPVGGTPIMLIHGSVGWSGFWKDISANLAAKGWRVIAIDVPPFGYSERDPKSRYDRVSQAKRFSEIVTQLGERPVHVVGHSFGGGAATEFALRYPEQVQSLILVDAAMGAIDPAKGRESFAGQILSFTPTSELVTSATVTNPYVLEPMLKPMLVNKDAAKLWVGTLFEPMRRTGSTTAYAQWLPNLFSEDDGAWSRETAKLEKITAPVALIWGRDDEVTPLSQGENLKKILRARTLIVLPKVGHIPHIEDPVAFNLSLDQALVAVGAKRSNER